MKFTIVKMTMENDFVIYKLRFTKWHLTKCLLLNVFTCGNSEKFSNDYGSYEEALTTIDQIEITRKARSSRKKEKFLVRRTDIPSHLPKEQGLKYISTEKIHDI